MLYTSAYQAPVIGTPTAISIYPPKDFKGDRLPLFAPTPELLQFWKNSSQNELAWEEYKEHFRKIIRHRWSQVTQWLAELTPEKDITLLCYKEKFCHRHLVGAIIKKNRPDCWGGEISDLEEELLSAIAHSQPAEQGEITLQFEKKQEEVTSKKKAVLLPPVDTVIYVNGYSGKVIYHWDEERVFVDGDRIYGVFHYSEITLDKPEIISIMKQTEMPEGWVNPTGQEFVTVNLTVLVYHVYLKHWMQGVIEEVDQKEGFRMAVINCKGKRIRAFSLKHLLVKEQQKIIEAA